ncbi:MAG: AraC family transcriptional regulator [Muribaculaceae bacterium]|nr:AraC family transcriptional regulator [Muribaculaceae bacterium]
MTKLDIEIDSAETPCFNKASERNAMEVIPKDIEKKLQVVLRHIEESAAFYGICGKDFNDATSVSSLALASGLSVRSLRDYFKAYTGQSLVKYVSQRRAEYAARIFRLYPNVSKAQAAYLLGFSFPNGIYRLMRKNGVANIDSLRSRIVNDSAIHLPFRKEYMSECLLFYKQLETNYDKSIAKSLLDCIAKVGIHVGIAVHQQPPFAETSNHSIGMAGFFFGVPGDQDNFGIEYVVKLEQDFMV